MIGMTSSFVVPDIEFRAIHYSKDTEKHTIMFKFKHTGGDINIVFDRDGEFGKFMVAVADSYCEGLQHFADEMNKEKS